MIFEVGAPTRYTKPLSENFVSDGYELIEFVERFWKTEDGRPFTLDPWQRDLVLAVLERYPDDWPVESLRGRLRYRQVVISVARQNGKSVFAAIFGLYALMMHETGPLVIGLASNADQANIIYRRVKYVIDSHPALKRRFKTTGTRGIRRLDKPGLYMVKPAKADALQGLDTTMCLFDEVHICPPDMWTAMVKGTTAKHDGLVLGITTAGDDRSELLKNLYATGAEAIAGEHERFGFFCWEAPEGAEIDDAEAITQANPAVSAGRIPVERLQEQVRTQPEHEALRYTHNRFVASESAWLPLSMWTKGKGEPLEGRPVFAIDRTVTWEHATITATIKAGDQIYTEVVASINKPTLEQLTDICIELNAHNPITFAMDSYTLKDLHNELESRGIPSKSLTLNEFSNGCATAYSQIANGAVIHKDEPLLRRQMPFAIKKYVGDVWRVSRQASSNDIDAVLSTIVGIYIATTHKAAPIQVF